MDGIIFAVNENTLADMHTVLSNPQAYKNCTTPIDHLKIMAYLYLDFAHENKKLWLMVFNYTLPDSQTPPESYMEKIDALFLPLEDMLAPLLPEENKRRIAARTLWSSVHGICYMDITNKTGLVGKHAARELIDFPIDAFVEGVRR